MSDNDATIPSEILDELPLPYLEVDARGVVVRANRATLELHALQRGDLLGQLACDFLPASEREQAYASFVEAVCKKQNPPPVRRAVFDKSGQYHSYRIFRSLIRDEGGDVQGMRMISVDISDTERQLEKERDSRAFLGSILNALSEAMLVTDALGFVRFANCATERLLGWKASEVLGKTIEQAVPILSFSSAHEKRLDFTMALQSPRRGIATVLNKARQELRVEFGTVPIINEENNFTSGVVSVLRLLEAA